MSEHIESGKSLAQNHYEVNPSPDDVVRFWKYTAIKSANNCWEWTGEKDTKNYGRLNIGGKMIRAHRISWVVHNGPIPNGFCVLHDCHNGDNPSCVNPAHLWLGTRADNNADCRAKGRNAKGDRNGARTHPERIARGDQHYSVRCPELVLRGDSNGAAKLTEANVRDIREKRSRGVMGIALAKEYNISPANVCLIVNFKAWRHIV